MAVTTQFSLATVTPGFTANGYTSDDQFGPEVIGLSNGGYAVVYGNEAAGGNDFPLVNIFGPDGQQVSSFSIPYASSPTEMDGDPEIIELADGNIAVIWDSLANGRIEGAILDPESGSVIHSEFVVDLFNVDQNPAATALANGNWVVVMQGNGDIWVQVMAPDGSRVGGQKRIDLSAAIDPVVTALADGGFVVTYTDNIVDAVAINATIYNADGTVRTADFKLSGTASAANANSQPAVAALKNGNWAVVYKDSGWHGDGITLQILDATGASVTPFIRVDTDAIPIEEDPDITVLPNGFIVVSWTDPGDSGNILGRIFDQNGNPVSLGGSTQPFVIANSQDAETDASISAMLNGMFAAAWADSGSDGSGSSISAAIMQVTSTIVSDAASDNFRGDAIRNIMYGNDGEDTIKGKGGDDALYGGNHDDLMFGGRGNDFLGGDAGHDNLRGQGGNDEIWGGLGNDSITAGTGDDTAYGGSGRDTVFGNNGADSIRGNGAADYLSGGNGRDTIFGDGGDDDIFGGRGNDVLNGDAGEDTLRGQDGRDTLNGGAGNDVLNGGAKADVFVFNGGDNADRIRDFQDNLDEIHLDATIWGGGLSVWQVLNIYGTELANGSYRLDFGFGDSLIIAGSGGVPVTEAALMNDIVLFNDLVPF